jgi:hypothetical protein
MQTIDFTPPNYIEVVYIPRSSLQGGVMNKQILLVALLLPTAVFAVDRGLGDVADDHTSKSTFRDNPHYSVGRPEHISLYRNDRLIARKDGAWGCLQVVGFGGHSSSSDELARYFMPYGKTCLTVGECGNVNDNTAGVINGGSSVFNNNTHDIIANNFGINTINHDFASYICFKPEQTFQGGAINYRQSLSDTEDTGIWFDFTMPIVHVRNKINLCERVINQGTPINGNNITNMTQAFLNPAWNYGKICPSGIDKTRIADLEIRIGRDGVRKEHCRYGGYVGVVVPTGNAQTGKYMFEPVIGGAHHAGIMWGSAMQFQLWQEDDLSLRTCLDMNNRYMFEHQEIRSFDLKDKQWSRYMNVFLDQNSTTSTPGINVFTRCMSIVPRASYQINTALVFQYRKFMVEGGFNFYARQAERGWLTMPWSTGPAIAGTAGAIGGANARSMNNATMRMWDNGLITDDAYQGALQVNPNNNELLYRPLTSADLDLASALHPAVINQTIYATLGYDDADCDYPHFAGLGSSLQWSHNNAGMNRWSVWGKVGLSV